MTGKGVPHSNNEFHPDAEMLRAMTLRELRDYALDHGLSLNEVDAAVDRAALLELVFANYHSFSPVDPHTGDRYDATYHRRAPRRRGNTPERGRGGWQNLSKGGSRCARCRGVLSLETR